MAKDGAASCRDATACALSEAGKIIAWGSAVPRTVPLPIGERVGVRGFESPSMTLTPTPPFSQPKSDLLTSADLKVPNSGKPSSVGRSGPVSRSRGSIPHMPVLGDRGAWARART
jgi:hypothetical protein